MRSNGSSRSISLATETPSLVIVGAPHFLSSTTLRPLGPSVTLTVSASRLRPLSMPRRASSSNLMILLIENVSFRDADRVRCPRRTTALVRRPHRTDALITLHVGVLTKILALTTTECKARSRALSPMRSGRNNLRRGRAGPLSAPTRPAPAVPLNDHCPGHSERSCAHHASSRAARNKIRPAQALRRHFREITRPAWALHRVIREKVRPARLKTAFFGHFGLAWRTFSRSRTHQAAQGELFRA